MKSEVVVKTNLRNKTERWEGAVVLILNATPRRRLFSQNAGGGLNAI